MFEEPDPKIIQIELQDNLLLALNDWGEIMMADLTASKKDFQWEVIPPPIWLERCTVCRNYPNKTFDGETHRVYCEHFSASSPHMRRSAEMWNTRMQFERSKGLLDEFREIRRSEKKEWKKREEKGSIPKE